VASVGVPSQDTRLSKDEEELMIARALTCPDAFAHYIWAYRSFSTSFSAFSWTSRVDRPTSSPSLSLALCSFLRSRR
jgi:hypothetical protein